MGKHLKYEIIFDYYKEAISKGTLKSGEKLPSESQLIEKFNVSRITVRKSLNLLEDECLIEKIQGKGCFVKQKQRLLSLTDIQSFSESITNAGFTASKKVLSNNVISADNIISNALNIAVGDLVFRLERIILADGIPLCVTVAYLPLAKFAGIEDYEFSTNSLYTILEEKYGAKIDYTEINLSAISADQVISYKLGVDENSPILLYDAIAYITTNNKRIPIEYCTSYYLTKTMSYRLEQTR